MSRLVQLGGTPSAPYDVYIGPAKNNVHWQLQASKWYLPQIRSMEEYRKAIVQGTNNLSELQGKVLGCFCGPTKRCHGNVLLYLLQPGIPEEEKAVLISGDSSPLSNSFLMKFIWEGREFHSLAHAYYYCLAKTNSSSSGALLDQIVCAPTLKLAAAAWKKCSACPSLCSQKRIEMMYKLLLVKWKQSKKFKRACREFGNRLIIQNSKDRFWGRGSSSADGGEEDVSCFEGMNISGWLLLALYDRKSIFLSDRNFMFDRLKLRLLRCTKGKANEKLLHGALLVSTQICT